MKVKEVMTQKSLIYCSPENTLQEAARMMKASNCGCLPVVDEDKVVLGIVTDRDICLALANGYHDKVTKTRIKDIIPDKVHTVHIDDHIATALKRMRTKRIGRIPVVDNKKRLKGLLTIHDLINGTFTGETDLADLASSGESLSRTVKALKERYSIKSLTDNNIVAAI